MNGQIMMIWALAIRNDRAMELYVEGNEIDEI